MVPLAQQLCLAIPRLSATVGKSSLYSPTQAAALTAQTLSRQEFMWVTDISWHEYLGVKVFPKLKSYALGSRCFIYS